MRQNAGHHQCYIKNSTQLKKLNDIQEEIYNMIHQEN